MAKWEILNADIPDKDGCDNFSSITGNKGNSELWAVKVNGEKDWAVLYYYTNGSNAKPTKTCLVKNVFGHAGGISCSSDYLYIGCRKINTPYDDEEQNRYIAKIPLNDTNKTGRNLTGTKTKNYFNTTNKFLIDTSEIDANIGTLSFFSSNKIIVRDLNYYNNSKINSEGLDKFYTVKYSGGSSPKYNFVENSEFYTYVPEKYRNKIEHCQDFFYDRSMGYLYVIYNLKPEAGKEIIDNRIFVYDLNGTYALRDEMPCYSKFHTLTIDQSGCSEGAKYNKIEIESATLGKLGKLLLCGNFKKNGKACDMIIRLPNFNPSNPGVN